ncbi:MAG: sulfatase-like hydrolase/transferase, partial [Alphaproteobacteria bacterium]|nr:sulfatase-like hydrolase/transferase [Alphaproteobacteria bacterium]
LIDTSSKRFPCNSLLKNTKTVLKQYFHKRKFVDGKIFEKDSILDKGSSFNDKSFKNNNIILLFTEGTSLRVISKDLTPNAYTLMNKSIVFDNYYNHTAATFRGIRGQLTSGIQRLGGYYPSNNGFGQVSQEKLKLMLKNKPESLSTILKDNGYYTVFVSPHSDEHFNNYIQEIGGFDKISYTGKGDNPNTGNLTDKELYEKIFEEYELASKQDKPFFIATYVLGTHEGMDSPDVKYKDGKNPYLNKFHNQDVWFGKFFEKYNKTSTAKNTMLIYTTDHCTHSSTGYNSTFNYPDIDWIDTIPFFVYKQNLKHKVYDADGLTSINLAPTVLDMLGIHKVRNHFLGHSLFETGRHNPIEYQRFLGESCSDTKTKKGLDFRKDCTPAEEYYFYAG